MPAPIGIPCDLCGQKFFKRSLPIHRKQCEKKFSTCYTECKKCLRKVSNDEYEKHLSECKVVRKKAVPKPKLVKPTKPPKDDGDSSSESSSDEEDSREQCGFCERKFSPDRIAKHESICATNAEKKKRKQFKTSSQQRLEGTDFEAYMDPSTRRQVEKPPSVWRSKHESLQNVVEQGRLVKAFQEAGVPLSELPSSGVDLKKLAQTGDAKTMAVNPADVEVPEGMTRCQHCKRTFNDTAAAKHIPKCKTTKNKPKTLKRKSQPVLERPKQDHSEVIKTIAQKVLQMKNRKNDFFETKEASMFLENETVLTSDGRKGTVRYIGRVSELFPGYWIGIELEEANGNNDGSIEGHAYFKCGDKCGCFLRPSKVKKNIAKIVAPKKEETKAKKEEAQPAADQEKKDVKKAKSAAPEVTSDDEKAGKKANKQLKEKKSMVDKLREEVRANSPRTEDQKKPKKKAATTNSKAVSKANAAKAQKQKRIEKDVKLLEQLHGKMSNGERGFGSREEVGYGQKLGATGGGQKLSSEPAKAKSKTAAKAENRPDRAARAAYFEKMFAQKNQ